MPHGTNSEHNESRMKRVSILGILLGFIFMTPVLGEETAKVSLVCLSPRFLSTVATNSGIIYSLDLMSRSGLLAPNLELRPDYYDSVGDFNKLAGFYRIHANVYSVAPEDDFVIGMPPFTDANRNGLDDFYDVSQNVDPVTTTGIIEDTAGGVGEVTAVWQRDANSATGLCQIRIRCSLLRLDVTFPTSFELLAYSGTLKYTPGNPNITGWLTLTSKGNSSDGISGPVQFTKSGTDLLSGAGGSWTNSAGQTLKYDWKLPSNSEASLLERFGANYFGLLSFEDGNFKTPWPDNLVWALIITDSNDANHDGIPDFSDLAIPSQPPRQPALALRQVNRQLLFSVSGEVGSTLVFEQKSELLQPNWANGFSLVLTNDPQIFLQPFPADPARFWRVRSGP